MDLVVVVDMVNGFINEGNLADKKINRIVNNVCSVIENAKANNNKIIAFKDTHEENDIEFEIFAPHCIKGTNECELITELKKYEKDMYIIEKPTTNGFDTKKFKNFIKNKNFDNVVVVGCCTDICVYNFVESLSNYFINNNIKTQIIVPKNAVDTFTVKNHDADLVNIEYLNKMKKMGVSIVEIKESAQELTKTKI